MAGDWTPFRGSVPRVVLPRIAAVPAGGRLLQLGSFGDGWLAARLDGDEVVLFDRDLRPRRRIGISLASEEHVRPHVALSADESLAAVSRRGGLCVYACDERGSARALWEAVHRPWESCEGGACAFDRASRLWSVGGEGPAFDRVAVSEAASGRVIASVPIEVESCGYLLFVHPRGDGAMIDGGAGQDGSFLWRVQLDRDGPSVRRLETDDRIMGGFSADRARFVTMPHDEGPVSVHGWPDCGVTESLDERDVFLGREEAERESTADSFDYRAAFLPDGRIVADTRQRRLLLVGGTPLAPVAELWPEGFDVRGHGDRGQPTDDPEEVVDYERDMSFWALSATGDRLLTARYHGLLELWDLSVVHRG